MVAPCIKIARERLLTWLLVEKRNLDERIEKLEKAIRDDEEDV